MFSKKKNKINTTSKNIIEDFILALYLNQRFVYDILAIKNDGFTEFYEVKDRKEKSDNIGAGVSASFGNDNKFSLINTSIEASANETLSNNNQNEKNYKKTHTPASLFIQAYQYLKDNKKIKKLINIEDLNNISSGDFVELKSRIKINTMIELFETMSKALDITETFSKFDEKYNAKNSATSKLKKNIDSVMEILKGENDKVKYGICELDNKQLVLKLNKEYFINSDYSEIKNGEFRIIGKVLEVIPENESVLLNRDNAIGLYDTNIFEPVKEAAYNMNMLNIGEFQDKVDGKTCVIMPIAIGI
ncbi:MAG: hypothetical protein J6K42_01715 [Clostridia bacterium]|nr:hypothetical protein [Clostridia bacterium]